MEGSSITRNFERKARFCFYQGMCKKKALETGISLHKGLVGENPGGGGWSFTGDSEKQLKKGSLRGASLYGTSIRGTWRGGSFTGNAVGYEKVFGNGHHTP
jgi:hypothetical protein